MKFLLTGLLLTGAPAFVQAQVGADSLHEEVLNKGIVDSLFVLGTWNEAGGTETQLNYLGRITTATGTFKIMTSCWLWGLSKRATNRVLVFSSDNQYLGNYALSMKCDLPERIEDISLVFRRGACADCDPQLTTRISFEQGIPDRFFLGCSDGHGDIYEFDRE